MTSSRLDMKRIPLVLLALVALAAAGCGSSNKSPSSSSSSSSAPATSTASGGSAAGGKTVTITMKNVAFSPSSVTVKVGQTVKWVNQDSVPHNITGGPLHSTTFSNGGSYTYTPKSAGKISYVCTIHPGMTATLNVTS
jgi:plastocyanin